MLYLSIMNDCVLYLPNPQALTTLERFYHVARNELQSSNCIWKLIGINNTVNSLIIVGIVDTLSRKRYISSIVSLVVDNSKDDINAAVKSSLSKRFFGVA